MAVFGIAPAIANAVARAVGVRIKDLPMSAEKLLEQIKKNGKEGSTHTPVVAVGATGRSPTPADTGNIHKTRNPRGRFMRDQSSMQVARVTLLIILSGCLLTASQAGAQTQAELIAGAKKKAKLCFGAPCASMTRKLWRQVSARYPFIKVDIFRAGVTNRQPSHGRASDGKELTYDVVSTFALKVHPKQGDAADPTAAPRELIIQRALDSQNYWVSLYSGYNVIGYNTGNWCQKLKLRRIGRIS